MGSCCSKGVNVVPVNTYTYRQHDFSFIQWLLQQKGFYQISESVFQQILLEYSRTGYVSVEQRQKWFESRMEYHMNMEISRIRLQYEQRFRQNSYTQHKVLLQDMERDVNNVHLHYLIPAEQHAGYQFQTSQHQTTRHVTTTQRRQTTYISHRERQLQRIREQEQHYVTQLYNQRSQYQGQGSHQGRRRQYDVNRHLAGPWYRQWYGGSRQQQELHRQNDRSQANTLTVDRRYQHQQRYMLEDHQREQMVDLRDKFGRDLEHRSAALEREEILRRMREQRRQQYLIYHHMQSEPEQNQNPDYDFIQNLLREENGGNMDNIGIALRNYLLKLYREQYEQTGEDADGEDSEFYQKLRLIGENFENKLKNLPPGVSEQELLAMLQLYKLQIKDEFDSYYRERKNRATEEHLNSDRDFLDNLEDSDVESDDVARKMRERLQGEGGDMDQETNGILESAEEEVEGLDGDERTRSALLDILQKYREKLAKTENVNDNNEDEDDNGGKDQDDKFVHGLASEDLDDVDRITGLFRDRFMEGEPVDSDEDSTLRKKLAEELAGEIQQYSMDGGELSREQLLGLMLKYRDRLQQARHDHHIQAALDEDERFVNDIPEDRFEDNDFLAEQLKQRLENLDDIVPSEANDAEKEDSVDNSDGSGGSESEGEDDESGGTFTDIPGIESLVEDPVYNERAKAVVEEYGEKINTELGKENASESDILELVMAQRRELLELVEQREITKQVSDSGSDDSEDDLEKPNLKEALDRKNQGVITEEDYQALVEEHRKNQEQAKENRKIEKERLKLRLLKKLQRKQNKGRDFEESDSEDDDGDDEEDNEEVQKALDQKDRGQITAEQYQELVDRHQQDAHDLRQHKKMEKDKLREKLRQRLEMSKQNDRVEEENSEAENDSEEEEVGSFSEVIKKRERGQITEEEYSRLLREHVQNVEQLKVHKGKEKDRLNERLQKALQSRQKKKEEGASDSGNDQGNTVDGDDEETNEEDEIIENDEEIKKMDEELKEKLKLDNSVSADKVQDLITKHKANREELKNRLKNQRGKMDDKLAARLSEKAKKEKKPKRPETAEKKEKAVDFIAKETKRHKEHSEIRSRAQEEHKKRAQIKLQEKKRKRINMVEDSTKADGDVDIKTLTMEEILSSQGKTEKARALFPNNLTKITPIPEEASQEPDSAVDNKEPQSNQEPDSAVNNKEPQSNQESDSAVDNKEPQSNQESDSAVDNKEPLSNQEPDSAVDNKEPQSNQESDSAVDNKEPQSNQESDSAVDNKEPQSNQEPDSAVDNKEPQSNREPDSAVDNKEPQSNGVTVNHL